MSTKKIIDVSEHQGKIDWAKVKSQIDGVILRCGYGDDISTQDDKYFTYNLAECERLNIPHGVYLYSYATSTSQAHSELKHILRLIQGHKFQLPIYVDVEQPGTETFANTACKIICDGLIQNGFKTGVYANLNWWNNYLPSLTKYDRWVAQYNTKCEYKKEYSMWQYTDKGKVNGISTNVDMNYFYGEFINMNKQDTTTSKTGTSAKTIIDKALSYIGTYDNGNNDVLFNTDYYGNKVSGDAYPWCCAFVWDIFRMCNYSHLFYDGKKTAYCPTVHQWGINTGLAINKNEGTYGDIVLFDWNNDGVADHIGLIISRNADGSYTTVEGNTANYDYSNGGYVLKMTRYVSNIISIIRPKYDIKSSNSVSNANNSETKLNIHYQVFTHKSGWLPIVTNLEDYAGIDNEAIKGIRVMLNGDTICVETHQLSTGDIDKVTMYAGKHKVKYRVKPIGGDYLDWMENKHDTGGSTDTYAGIAGKPIDRIQITII